MQPDAEEYIYYIKSILIFSIIYVLYLRFGRIVLIAVLTTVPLFLLYELSEAPFGMRPLACALDMNTFYRPFDRWS